MPRGPAFHIIAAFYCTSLVTSQHCFFFSLAHPLLSYSDAGTSSQPLWHLYACVMTDKIASFTALLSENVPPGQP
jgi:hypothetical protein